jgi:RNA polymerase primary sigma factor
MNMDPRRLERIHEAARTHSVSLQAGPSEEGYALEETIPDSRAQAPGKALDDDFVGDVLERAMSGLDEMEMDILRKRFGLDDGGERTLREVGADYGLSRERIRQLQNKVLTKLRGELNRHGVTAPC